MTAYRVTARRSGDWWALAVPDLPGVFTQAKRLDKAESVAREAIALMLDTDPAEVDVCVEPELADDARQALSEARQARKAAQEAVEVERSAMERAAAVLTRDLSQRDAGRLLHVSFQRVSQLLHPQPARPRVSAD